MMEEALEISKEEVMELGEILGVETTVVKEAGKTDLVMEIKEEMVMEVGEVVMVMTVLEVVMTSGLMIS